MYKSSALRRPSVQLDSILQITIIAPKRSLFLCVYIYVYACTNALTYFHTHTRARFRWLAHGWWIFSGIFVGQYVYCSSTVIIWGWLNDKSVSPRFPLFPPHPPGSFFPTTTPLIRRHAGPLRSKRAPAVVRTRAHKRVRGESPTR